MAFPRSGTVDTQTFSGTKDFVFARLNTTQSSNISVGDHLKFDTVDFARGGVGDPLGAGAKMGGAVSLDTTTTYSNTSGVASIGRFTVRGGKIYKLYCDPGYALFSGNTGIVTVQWFDVTTGTAAALTGAPTMIEPVTETTNDNSSGVLDAFYQPGGGQNDLFLLEVQIVAVTALTSFGSSSKGQATALVETF
jgi:hypothetical protein